MSQTGQRRGRNVQRCRSDAADLRCRSAWICTAAFWVTDQPFSIQPTTLLHRKHMFPFHPVPGRGGGTCPSNIIIHTDKLDTLTSNSTTFIMSINWWNTSFRNETVLYDVLSLFAALNHFHSSITLSENLNKCLCVVLVWWLNCVFQYNRLAEPKHFKCLTAVQKHHNKLIKR